MRKLLFAIALIAVQFTFAQTQDALVFFADKENVQTSIDNPLTILTQEAIDRKTSHGVVIDERDVPVTEDYITQIKSATGITVFAKSKWMNAVYVQGTMTNIDNLLALAFVTAVEYMDKDLNTFPGITHGGVDKFEMEVPAGSGNGRVEYDYGAAANQIEMISGDYLHEQDFTGDGMIIAVTDSGFPGFSTNPAFSHIVNEGRLLGTFDFFSRTADVTGTGSHGINTTSDIGGFIQNQFVGTAPGASFYLFRTEYGPDENPREEAWWVEALERADSLGVDVINTSLGYQEYDNPNYTHNYQDLDGQTTIGARGANHAVDKGLLIVTSAGNQGNSFGTVATPADSPGLYAAGAVNGSGNYVSFSSRGPTVDGRIKPDGMAQGQSAAVVTSGGNVSTSNGTSFSSPILAGAITCLWQSSPTSTNVEIIQVVRESSHLYENPTDEMGYGIPNFQEAYNVLQDLGFEDELLQSNFAIYPNPVTDIVNVSFPANLDNASLTIYNVLGKQVLERSISSSENQVNIAALVSGMYIATLEADGITNSFKIIKQ